MPITYAPHEDPVQKWPPFLGPVGKIPTTRAEVVKVFGNAGDMDNIIDLGKGSIAPGRFFPCHRLLVPYVKEGLRRASIVCPDYKIHDAWSYNYRHIRHDPSRALSLHSWGIAVDFNTRDNRGVSFKHTEDVPDFFSPEWKKIWPDGMPREFVDAMISVGFVWGGDWDRDWDAKDQRYVDPMHFQLALCG